MVGETKGVRPKQPTPRKGSAKPKAVSKMGRRPVKKLKTSVNDSSLAAEVTFVAQLLRKEVDSLTKRRVTKGSPEN